jgi:hypothetical protein
VKSMLCYTSCAEYVFVMMYKGFNKVGVAGHVLDCSTAWQLLGVLQAVGALPSRRQECE